jgi:hypothetical protein
MGGHGHVSWRSDRERLLSVSRLREPCDVAAARAWIRDGNVGALTFNEACGWLGWDAEHLRWAIFSPVRGA